MSLDERRFPASVPDLLPIALLRTGQVQVRDFTLQDMQTYACANVAADRAQRQAAPYAFAVHFPDQPTEELVHDLDELVDDLTNRHHTITSLYTAPPAAPVPEGFKLMPLEPTEAMCLAGLPDPQSQVAHLCAGYRADAYRAMLAAAPNYPAQSHLSRVISERQNRLSLTFQPI